MEEQDNQIIAYLNNQLSAKDKTAFELVMQKDKTLADEVDLYSDLYEVHEQIGEETLVATIQSVNDAYFQKAAIENVAANEQGTSTGKSSLLKWGLSVAAGFLLLLAVGSWWAHQNYSDESLAVNSFTNKQITSFVRSTNNAINDPFAEGLVALNNQDYTKATAFFSAFRAEATFYKEAQLYLALAQFKARDYKSAQANARIVMQTSSQFVPKAKWLLMNALLANRETEGEFQQLLVELANDVDNPYYQKNAQILQRNLDVFWRKLIF